MSKRSIEDSDAEKSRKKSNSELTSNVNEEEISDCFGIVNADSSPIVATENGTSVTQSPSNIQLVNSPINQENNSTNIFQCQKVLEPSNTSFDIPEVLQNSGSSTNCCPSLGISEHSESFIKVKEEPIGRESCRPQSESDDDEIMIVGTFIAEKKTRPKKKNIDDDVVFLEEVVIKKEYEEVLIAGDDYEDNSLTDNLCINTNGAENGNGSELKKVVVVKEECKEVLVNGNYSENNSVTKDLSITTNDAENGEHSEFETDVACANVETSIAIENLENNVISTIQNVDHMTCNAVEQIKSNESSGNNVENNINENMASLSIKLEANSTVDISKGFIKKEIDDMEVDGGLNLKTNEIEKNAETLAMENNVCISSLTIKQERKDAPNTIKNNENNLEVTVSVKKERDSEMCQDVSMPVQPDTDTKSMCEENRHSPSLFANTNIQINSESASPQFNAVFSSDLQTQLDFNDMSITENMQNNTNNDEDLCDTAPSSPVAIENENGSHELTFEELSFSNLLLAETDKNLSATMQVSVATAGQQNDKIFDPMFQIDLSDYNFSVLRELNLNSKRDYIDLLNCAIILSTISKYLKVDDSNSSLKEANFEDAIKQSLLVYTDDIGDLVNICRKRVSTSITKQEFPMISSHFPTSSCNVPVFSSQPCRESAVYECPSVNSNPFLPNRELFDLNAVKCLEDWEIEEIKKVIPPSSLNNKTSEPNSFDWSPSSELKVIETVSTQQRKRSLPETERFEPLSKSVQSPATLNRRISLRSETEMPHKIPRSDVAIGTSTSETPGNLIPRANPALINDPLVNSSRHNSEEDDRFAITRNKVEKVKDLRELLNRKNYLF